ncbi:MAG: helix-turn-helix transcriptional regulator [Polyangiales bacterium]
MEPSGSAIIDFIETVYNLELGQEQWLPKLLEAGGPVLDHGLGVFALTCLRPPQRGPVVIDQIHVGSGPNDLLQRVTRMQQELPPDLLWPLSRPAMPRTLSDGAGDDFDAFDQVMRHFEFAKDAIGISVFDPDGRGVFLIAPLDKVTTLSKKASERWQMIGAHFGAGYRLRRALAHVASRPETDLPHGAEALIDPKSLRVVEAQGQAKSHNARAALRTAALHVDRARGALRESDPEKALQLWTALVQGRWSTVDWFDSDGRRFVLGVPNAPNIIDPRGLTNREMQVVSYALCGQTNKLIAYHLGLTRGRVSTLLRSAMRKLGVQTRAELIKKLNEFSAIR